MDALSPAGSVPSHAEAAPENISSDVADQPRRRVAFMSPFWLDARPPHRALLVLWCLAEYAGTKDRRGRDLPDGVRACWPKIDTIADRTGVERRAVQRAFKWLETHGIIEVEKTRTRTSNVIKLHDQPATNRHRRYLQPIDDDQLVLGSDEDRRAVKMTTHDPTKGGQNDHPKGGQNDRFKGGQIDHPEQTIEQKQSNNNNTAVAAEDFPKDGDRERLELAVKLVSRGIQRRRAEQLAHDLPPDRIRRDLERPIPPSVKYPAAWLITALTSDDEWAAPVAAPARQAATAPTSNEPDPWNVIWPRLDELADMTTIAVEWYDEAHGGDVMALKTPPAAFVSHARWLIDFVTEHGDDELPPQGCYCGQCRVKRDRAAS